MQEEKEVRWSQVIVIVALLLMISIGNVISNIKNSRRIDALSDDIALSNAQNNAVLTDLVNQFNIKDSMYNDNFHRIHSFFNSIQGQRFSMLQDSLNIDSLKPNGCFDNQSIYITIEKVTAEGVHIKVINPETNGVRGEYYIRPDNDFSCFNFVGGRTDCDTFMCEVNDDEQ